VSSVKLVYIGIPLEGSPVDPFILMPLRVLCEEGFSPFPHNGSMSRSHSILPRLIRLRDAPSYLGMDRNKFNKHVRPYLTEIPLGKQAVAFDRLEIDAWIEDYIGRNGRRPKASTFEDDICQNLTNQNAIKCRGSALGSVANSDRMCKIIIDT